MRIRNLCCRIAAFAGLILSTSRAGAFDPGAAAGDWHILNFSVPSQLTLQRNAQGVVTNIPEASNFDNSTGMITVLSNGTFSGIAPDPVSGTIMPGGQGEVVLTPTSGGGPPAMTFHLNRAADFMTTCSRSDPGYQDLIVAMRAPTTLTTNDLTGLWNMTALDTPNLLVLDRDVSNRVVNIQGLNNFETYGGTITVRSNGTFTGDAQGAVSGAVVDLGGGTVNFVVTNDQQEVFPISFFINASKDVTAYLESAYGIDDNYQQILILQKASPTNPVPAGHLAAPWRIITYDVPQLTPQYNGQGKLIGLDGNNNFDAERQSLVAGYDGFFTALVGDVATGTLSPATDGVVTMNVQSENGTETIGFNLNAGESLLTSARSLGDGWELLLLTESAPVPGSAQDFGLLMSSVANGLELNWAAATNSVLQSSSNLTSWNALGNTLGLHTYTTIPSDGAAFYRVAQPMP